MPATGNVKFDWDALCREAEFMRWIGNVQRNFKANKNTDKESQVAFLQNRLGATGERLLESHKWSEADKENVNTII